jgi:hypothetical protein
MTHSVFPVLVEAALRALAAAVVVWTALRLLRVRNVPAQKTVWTLMLLGALAMPLLMRWQWLPAADAVQLPAISRSLMAQYAAAATPPAATLPGEIAPASQAAPPPPAFAWSVDPAPTRSTTDSSTEANNSSTEIDLQDTPANAPATLSLLPSQHDFASPFANADAPPQKHPYRLLTLAWFIYLAVAAALLLRLFAGLISALHLWITADPVFSPTFADLAPAGSVRCSLRVSSPANLGSGILLPAEYGEWSLEKLRVVIAHERAHVRQRDFYLQLAAGLYAALVWFSPLGWWLKHKLSELGEAIGDRAGLAHAASPSSYAQVLLEFAALPRPIREGVAMARTGHLAGRIERLLNDTAFHRAFTGNRRRALLSLVIVPVAVLASSALVRVHAAAQIADPAQQPVQAQSPSASPQSGVSTPPQQAITSQNQEQAEPAPPPQPSPEAEPAPAPPQPPAGQAPEPSPQAAPAPPAPEVPGEVAVPRIPAVPPIDVHIPPMPPLNAELNQSLRLQMDAMRQGLYRNHSFFAFDGGEPWALVPAQGEPIMNSPYSEQRNEVDRAEIDQARKTAHAPFFWFRHDGKSYLVDDPSVVAQIESLEKPVEDLRSQMRALGKQQRDLGEQLRQKMREQRQAPIPKPDLSKQMADLNAAVDSLKASQGDTVTRDQLMKLQRQLGELQGQLARAESGFYRENGQWGAEMGAFGKQMGQLGAEQGRLAGEMAQRSTSNRAKIDSLIEQSLRDGNAKPVK